MGKSTNNYSQFIIRFLLPVLVFWILLCLIFYINDIPTDGEKKYGIPFPVVIAYIDRVNQVVYEYYYKGVNVIYNLLFIAFVTGFYYYLFKKLYPVNKK